MGGGKKNRQGQGSEWRQTEAGYTNITGRHPPRRRGIHAVERLGCAVEVGGLPPTRERRPFLLHRHFYHSAITLPAPKSSSSAKAGDPCDARARKGGDSVLDLRPPLFKKHGDDDGVGGGKMTTEWRDGQDADL